MSARTSLAAGVGGLACTPPDALPDRPSAWEAAAAVTPSCTAYSQLLYSICAAAVFYVLWGEVWGKTVARAAVQRSNRARWRRADKLRLLTCECIACVNGTLRPASLVSIWKAGLGLRCEGVGSSAKVVPSNQQAVQCCFSLCRQ